MLSKIKKVGLGIAAVSGAAVGGAAVAGAANSDSGATAVPPTASGKPPPALLDACPGHRRDSSFDMMGGPGGWGGGLPPSGTNN